jgi:outer membrane protein OmpA-like peptidoglycan-associated protein
MKKHGWQILFVVLIAWVFTAIAPVLGNAQTTQRTTPPSSTRKIIPVPRDNNQSNIKVDVWFDKQCGSPYRQGEKIMINFRTNIDGYVTVYDIDTRGQVSVLFPNPNYPDNLVRANQVYTMPNPSYTYDLMVEGPEGIEYVDVVAAADPYYHWNVKQSEPRWVYDWGLKGSQDRSLKRQAPADYQNSPEFRNRPKELGNTGKESIIENYTKSRQIQEQIRSKIITVPRESPQQISPDYATATCYFYVTGEQAGYGQTPSQDSQYPSQSMSREEYLRQQQRDFERIPDVDVRRSGERLIVAIPNTILFDYDSYDLRYEARQDLDQVANVLARYPETMITIAGHTDSIGDADYNQRLSEYRAQAVSNYLISRGVNPYRVSAVGYGETSPVASNANEAGRQRNRRVELSISVSPQYGTNQPFRAPGR